MLTIVLRSFSYREGYPKETSQHGGGFIFDCRSLPNPGRFPEFHQYSGLDQCVIDWLENDGSYRKLLEPIKDLVKYHITEFSKKGYREIIISFGCTGGQHRSVFMAKKLNEYLNELLLPNLEIIIEHTQKNNWPK